MEITAGSPIDIDLIEDEEQQLHYRGARHSLGLIVENSKETTVTPRRSNFLVGLLSEYKKTVNVFPLFTKVVTGVLITLCGDAIAQSKNEGEYDIRRGASFVAFDMVFRVFQHFALPCMFAYCQGRILGSLPLIGSLKPSKLAAMEQTLASQLGLVPFIYFPAFFTISGAIQGLSPEASWSRAVHSFVPLMKRNLTFWVPVQFIQFGVIKEDLRMPFLSVAGMVWIFILSANAGSTKSYIPANEILSKQQNSVE